jgi:hypothetical protein
MTNGQLRANIVLVSNVIFQAKKINLLQDLLRLMKTKSLPLGIKVNNLNGLVRKRRFIGLVISL